MSRKSLIFLLGYAASLLLFTLSILFGTSTPKNHENLRRFGKVSTMSDAAFYSDLYAIRFYSLSKTHDFWDDPFLPPRIDVDFVYRMKR